MRWGATKLQVADLAGAQPSTSAVSSIIEDTRVHDSLENNANILETKETEKEIDAEAEPSLEEGSSSDSAKSSNVQFSNTIASDTVINKEENLVAGMAFDNYDRFVDTKPGKDTLHDTVGIMYQNINPKDDNVEEEEEEENEDNEGCKRDRPRQRSFETIDFELPQCAKKLQKIRNIQTESEEEVHIIVHKSLRSN
ncbi:hypothetical protein J6590_019451 [Homalodisca vitripennis]|nr:hypothetical protein J6590_019451 [Homalodisca vitripennis]